MNLLSEIIKYDLQRPRKNRMSTLVSEIISLRQAKPQPPVWLPHTLALLIIKAYRFPHRAVILNKLISTAINIAAYISTSSSYSLYNFPTLYVICITCFQNTTFPLLSILSFTFNPLSPQKTRKPQIFSFSVFRYTLAFIIPLAPLKTIHHHSFVTYILS